MAEALGLLLESRERLEGLRESCRNAAEELSWQTESRKLVRAYDAIFAARAADAPAETPR